MLCYLVKFTKSVMQFRISGLVIEHLGLCPQCINHQTTFSFTYQFLNPLIVDRLWEVCWQLFGREPHDTTTIGIRLHQTLLEVFVGRCCWSKVLQSEIDSMYGGVKGTYTKYIPNINMRNIETTFFTCSEQRKLEL